MTYHQCAHRREAYGVRGSSTSRSDALCEGSMSRGEGTGMASYRGVTTGATTTATAQGPASSAPAGDATQASGGRGLQRAALDARVSTDKHEREETVASQVDLLHQTAAAHGYEVLPGHGFIADGVSGTRLDRPALERLRDLAAEGAFAEYERALIHERTRRGQLFAARQGRVNWGNPPYGYTDVHKTTTTPQHLVINEAEAEVVRQIYRWCVEEQRSS